MSSSPKLFVTAATGQLGRLVIDALLERVPASAIAAGVRDPSKDAALAIRDKGVELRLADYARPETLEAAMLGVDRLLLISSSEIGQRKEQHRNVIAAAKGAGVGLVAYTSGLHADTSPLFVADEHRDTEAALAESGLPFVLLRNGWYSEVFTWRLPIALKTGTLIGAAGEGRISPAARADYAEAAAAVLAGGDHVGRTYELAGDAPFTLSELVSLASEAAGKPIAYKDMTPDDLKAAAIRAGLPEMFAIMLSDTDAGLANGALFDNGGELARLIGRPTTPVQSTIRSFIQNLPSPQPGSPS
ncbi:MULTISPECIES: SDR family oxidoreductase [Sinorhizobium]|uniref:SDR family oxidoreductase n=1 Tax=Sinorhizobium TaxID=28105 RepID=UPI000BE8CA31|nr:MULTISPECIES: SDR family oxidoreductase [Sinorhizobium]PDT49560.1 NAD(P)-dependent oxidoreductase [Sinorhizobium sp. NG07B]POH33431.1 NAD(P)-dependent oxidoreductase [Sinorhizobium americanum]